jgi:hypothetical protein
MTRRVLLAAPFARRLLAAESAAEVYELVAGAAAYLSESDAQGFLACFDKGMPGYNAFAASVEGMLRQCEVQSSVEVLRNEGDDAARVLEFDWLVQLKLRYETGQVERRRETVKCRAQRAGKRWKFVSFAPQSLLAPMKITR